MMADQKYVEVQTLIEVQLIEKSNSRMELLGIYFDCLEAQHKSLPADLIIELAQQMSLIQNHQQVNVLLNKLRHPYQANHYLIIKKLKIMAALDMGQMDQFYQLINEFLIIQYQKKIPSIPAWLGSLMDKYFKNDFGLKLKLLAIVLLKHDFNQAEVITKELILSCVERTSPKGTSLKLNAVYEILKMIPDKGQLEIYQSYCFLTANGLVDKSDYKRVVEMVIYFEDFKFQVLTLNLLDHLNLTQMAREYAAEIKINPEYNFIYFDKFFNHLKKYYIRHIESSKKPAYESISVTDLKLIANVKEEIMSPALDVEVFEDEQKYLNILKFQTYNKDQLCDLAVSFLQAQMPKVALKAAEQAMQQSEQDQDYLKASYLKLSSELLLKDFRAGLDTCLQALDKSSTVDDILSFLYAQAEIYIRLKQDRDAKKILKKILSIDSKYRLAQERFDKLNEI